MRALARRPCAFSDCLVRTCAVGAPETTAATGRFASPSDVVRFLRLASGSTATDQRAEHAASARASTGALSPPVTPLVRARKPMAVCDIGEQSLEDLENLSV